jgi:epsilon-lactone hydrolase
MPRERRQPPLDTGAHVVLYFHGGVYVMGDAFLAADLAAQVGRRTRSKVISLDYRLAPVARFDSVDGDLGGWDAAQRAGDHGYVGGQWLRG